MGEKFLIIAEKPKAALRIALALSEGRITKHRMCKVSYWSFNADGNTYFVVSAAGHMFDITSEVKGFPVFEYRWEPLWIIDRNSAFKRKFFKVIRNLSKKVHGYIVACDYDVEGSVIGYKIVEALNGLDRARRMIFSSLVREDVRRAFDNIMPSLDWNIIEAGLTRCELDWLWGINISRLLAKAFREVTGEKILLSAGRVQSPTLVEVACREEIRKLHVPIPYFTIRAEVLVKDKKYELTYVGRPFKTKKSAEELTSKIRKLRIAEVHLSTVTRSPPPPFNLGSLQREAYRIYGFSPLRTQRIAEDLYLDALISYPRTSSQKLPDHLDNLSILKRLKEHQEYGSIISRLLAETKGVLRPAEGRREDPAHPAIYPTGVLPQEMNNSKWKIYDLVTRRYIACFSKKAVLKRLSAFFDVEREVLFKLEISGIVHEGWTRYYPFVKCRTYEPADLREGDVVEISRVHVEMKYTNPPRPYNKANLLKWMEEKQVGTESTRARIIEVLVKRGYLVEWGRGNLTTTILGEILSEIFKTYFPQISSTDLTRKFEQYIDAIINERKRRHEVIEEAKKLLSKVLKDAGEHSKSIGIVLAYSTNHVNAEKCEICNRRRLKNSIYCAYHNKAYTSLVNGYTDWNKALGSIGWREYLMEICKLKLTGSWILDVAKHILSRENIMGE